MQYFFGDSHAARLRFSWRRSKDLPREPWSPPDAIRGGRRALGANTLSEAVVSATCWHGASCPVIVWLGANDLRASGESLLPPSPATVAAAVAGLAMAIQSLLRGARFVVLGAPHAARSNGMLRRRTYDFNRALEATARIPGWVFIDPTRESGGARPWHCPDGTHLAAGFLEAILKVISVANLCIIENCQSCRSCHKWLVMLSEVINLCKYYTVQRLINQFILGEARGLGACLTSTFIQLRLCFTI